MKISGVAPARLAPRAGMGWGLWDEEAYHYTVHGALAQLEGAQNLDVLRCSVELVRARH